MYIQCLSAWNPKWPKMQRPSLLFFPATYTIFKANQQISSSSHFNSNILRASSIVPVMHTCTGTDTVQLHCVFPLKSFFVLFLALRYQHQPILLNYVVCQILIHMFDTTRFLVFNSRNVEPPIVQDQQVGVAIGSRHFFHVPWMPWMAMAEEESGPLGEKSCITLGGLILPKSVGDVGSVNIFISPILCVACR